jgi:hypothetical protein
MNGAGILGLIATASILTAVILLIFFFLILLVTIKAGKGMTPGSITKRAICALIFLLGATLLADGIGFLIAIIIILIIAVK